MAVLLGYEEVGTLKVKAGAGSELEYKLDFGQSHDAGHPLTLAEQAIDFAKSLDYRFFAPDTTDDQLHSVADVFLDLAVPAALGAPLKQWLSACPDGALLVVDAQEPVADLPWELLSSALGGPAQGGGRLFVVRRAPVDSPMGKPLEGMKMLLAGWTILKNGNRLPGVMRELGQIPAQVVGEGIEMVPLVSPSLEHFSEEVHRLDPDILHLSNANGFDTIDGTAFLWLDPEPGSQPQTKGFLESFGRVTDTDLVTLLGDVERLQLCVLNTMPNPPVADSPLYRTLTTELGVAVVGWSGAIQDAIAVDFALFLYKRLVEGATLPDAVRSFTQQFSDIQWVSGAIPTVWIPSEEWLTRPVLARIAEYPAVAAPAAHDFEIAEKVVAAAATVDLEFSPRESLFPSLLINGQEAVRALTLTANGSFDARLEILCDAGGRTSSYRRTVRLVSGPNTLDVRGIGFPVLYDLIESDQPRIVGFQVTVWVQDELVAQTTRWVRWRARREWLDSPDSYAYLPSFVLPMCKAVAALVRDAEEVLKQIGDPQESFSGYRRDREQRPGAADRQVKAIYQALRGWGLKYITPPGTPVFVIDPSEKPDRDPEIETASASERVGEEKVQSGQLVRLPDDIVERKHATCHDLSLLFAAAAEYVNLRPILVMLPGHTLFGVWLDRQEHDLFWRARAESPGLSQGIGHRWMIQPAELDDLIATERVRVIETTLVTNPIASYEQAERRVRKYLQQTVKATIDVRASRSSIQPLSLT